MLVYYLATGPHCFTFSQFADALLLILIFVFGISNILHYLDDLTFMHIICFRLSALHGYYMQSAFSELGVPFAPEEIIGPSTKITYLGIEIDYVANQFVYQQRNFRNCSSCSSSSSS